MVEKNNVEDVPIEDVILNITAKFQRNIYGLRHLVNDLYPVAQAHDDIAKDARLDFEKKISDQLISFQDKDKKVYKHLDQDKIDNLCHELIYIMERYDHAKLKYEFNDRRVQQLLSSSFILLVSHFDFLLSDIIHYYYRKYPEALSDKAQLTLSEIKECSSIDEAIDYFIDKRVESLSYKSFREQMTFFKNELSVPTQEDMTIWQEIQEIKLRRNILVHNEGVVNSRYLKGVTAFQTQMPVHGTILSVDKEYFVSSFSNLLAGGVILIQLCWRKWFPSQLSNADTKLCSLINELLSVWDFDTAYHLALFSRQIKTDNEKNRQLLDLYYCMAVKKLGRYDELDKEIAKLEKTNLDLECYVGLLAIKGLRKEFYENLKIAVDNDKIYQGKVIHSALYDDIRQDEDFHEHLNKIFSN